MITKALEVTIESQGVLQKLSMLDKGMLDDHVKEKSQKKKLPKKLQMENNQQLRVLEESSFLSMEDNEFVVVDLQFQCYNWGS